MILSLGNKNYSSWSLRPWLVLRWGKIAFEERVISLGGDGYGQGKIAAVKAVSPSGRVPALDLDGRTIWDSLAIAEWAADQVPSLWPADAITRSEARSASAEMHSGFSALRRDLSMNIKRRVKVTSLKEDTRDDLARLFELWTTLRRRHEKEGPWLFGARSIADAFYTPVATRLRTYEIEQPSLCAAYAQTLLNDADFKVWEADALKETWKIPSTDSLYA